MLRFVLLGLLNAEPRYGYELKVVFEAFLGGTWSLNIGQVYKALAKLETAGFVRSHVEHQDTTPDRKVYEITDAGQLALADWAMTPGDGVVRLRDDLFLRVGVLSMSDQLAARELIHEERLVLLNTLAEMGDLATDVNLHPSTLLLIEAAQLRVEADLRWLDLAEDRLKEWPDR